MIFTLHPSTIFAINFNNVISKNDTNIGIEGSIVLPGLEDCPGIWIRFAELEDQGLAGQAFPLVIVFIFGRFHGDTFCSSPGPTDLFSEQGMVEGDIVLELVSR